MMNGMSEPVLRARLRPALLAAALGCCAVWPAVARAANRDIERLQLQLNNVQGQLSDVSRQLDEALRELRRLNESLAEQNAQLRKSTQDAHAADEAAQAALRDLAERVSESAERLQAQINALAARSAATAEPYPGAGGVPSLPPGTVPTSPAGSPPPATPAPALPAGRELYSQAYADYARGNYDLAIQGFQEYLRGAPGTDLADNAQYWIGECLYGKQRYAEAVDAWNLLLREHAASDKLPDARVKKGMALEKLGRRSQALIEYRFVVDRFPNSSAARIARDRLNPN